MLSTNPPYHLQQMMANFRLDSALRGETALPAGTRRQNVRKELCRPTRSTQQKPAMRVTAPTSHPLATAFSPKVHKALALRCRRSSERFLLLSASYVKIPVLNSCGS